MPVGAKGADSGLKQLFPLVHFSRKGIVTLPMSASSPHVAEHGAASQPVPLLPDQAVAPSVSTPVAQGLPENRPMTLPHFEPLSIVISGFKAGC